MKISLIFFSLFAISSCARLVYYTEQGLGQMKLQWRGVKNEKVLNNPKISPAMKRKIELVGEYKKFFYHYFGEKPTGIYSKTTMLDDKAVTYLVIASKHTEIEAHEFKFLFVGSFPYIGFFSLDSAKDFAKDLEQEQGLVSWIRPVYAYSTLGYLEDRILSSFFYYDDVELAELVFHELFHTIFFIKNEVDLNENLANLYGRELLKEYFKESPDLSKFFEREEKKEKISRRIVELITILQDEFKKLGGFLTDEKADTLTQRFVDEVFKPDIKKYCQELKLEEDDCDIKDEWNQASFAAFLTYEEEQDFLMALKDKQKLPLRDFLSWLKTEQEVFKGQKKIESFTDYLKEKVSYAPATSH